MSVYKRNAHLSSVRLDSTWLRHGVATWPGQTKHAHAPHTPGRLTLLKMNQELSDLCTLRLCISPVVSYLLSTLVLSLQGATWDFLWGGGPGLLVAHAMMGGIAGVLLGDTCNPCHAVMLSQVTCHYMIFFSFIKFYPLRIMTEMTPTWKYKDLFSLLLALHTLPKVFVSFCGLW